MGHCDKTWYVGSGLLKFVAFDCTFCFLCQRHAYGTLVNGASKCHVLLLLVVVLPTWSVVTKWACLIPHLHIYSDWLIKKQANIQSSVWAKVTKFCMWVVVGTRGCTQIFFREYVPLRFSKVGSSEWIFSLKN